MAAHKAPNAKVNLTGLAGCKVRVARLNSTLSICLNCWSGCRLPNMTSSNPSSFKRVLKAVAGAFIGVQSEQQRQHDFNASTPWPYIIAGLVMAVLFVLAVMLTVFLVLR